MRTLLTTIVAAGLVTAVAARQGRAHLQVVSDVPESQLFLVMNAVATSLGVGCEYCHVRTPPSTDTVVGGWQFERDDKPTKAKGREMMRMVRELNASRFGGRPVITCFTCHHGSTRVVGTPPLPPAERPTPSAAVVLPSAQDVLRKYVAGVGGADAVARMTTVVMEGRDDRSEGRRATFTISAKGTDRFRVDLQWTGQPAIAQALNASGGWTLAGPAPQAMSAADVASLRRRVVRYAPLKVIEPVDAMRVDRQETIRGREALAVVATVDANTTRTYFFDAVSGLLLRESVVTATPLVPIQEQVDYDDYRAVSDLMLPFLIRSSNEAPYDTATRTFTSIRINVALDDAIFATPKTAPGQSPAEVFVRSARWLDPVSGEVRGPTVFQIDKGAIARVIPAAEFDRTKPPGANVTDLGAATILPGLIDAHVHLTIGGTPADMAMAVLRAGFTTVVDLGATTDAVLRLRDDIAAGKVTGPRILAAGLWAGSKDGVCEFGGIGIAGGPDGFRARVRDNVKAGADLIKVCVSGWLQDAWQKPDAYEIADASLAAAVEEAHLAKRAVVVHAISAGGVKAAVRAGVDGLAHAALIDQATADAMRQRNVFMVPTLASLVGERTGPAAVGLRQAVALAQRTGVRIVFGTDGGVLPHGENAREFAALAAAGLSPIESIRAATINAAQALRLGAAGSLAAGAPADLIAVDGNPLEDLAVLSRVQFVMRGGKIVRTR